MNETRDGYVFYLALSLAILTVVVATVLIAKGEISLTYTNENASSILFTHTTPTPTPLANVYKACCYCNNPDDCICLSTEYNNPSCSISQWKQITPNAYCHIQINQKR